MRGARLSGGERVLVRLPSWLGDFVMAEPAVRALAERLGSERLTLVGRAEHLGLLSGRFPGAARLALPAGAEALRWGGHDVALLCTGSFRSAWTAWRAGIPRRVGQARDGRGFLLTDRVSPAGERGRTPLGLGIPGRGARYLPRPLTRSLMELLGLLGVPVRDPRPRLVPDPRACQAARARRSALGLGEGEPYLLACVGARQGAAKGLSAALWAAILGPLARELPLVLACGPGEERSLEELRALLAGTRLLALLEPAALLPELLAHCQDARLVLGADSGPRHLARALGKPMVVVAGPTDPRHCALDARERLLRVPVPCGPCHRERCPLAGADERRCLTSIEPAHVVAAAHELLASPAAVTMAR